jgi:adenine-specific DNA-methyltransferase
MALLDDLVSQIPDVALRGRLQKAVTDLRRKQKFGLVFEEHIPETTALFGLPVQVGASVQRRQDSSDPVTYRVTKLGDMGKTAALVAADGSETAAATDDLLVVKRFGERMYASLKPLEKVRRGGDDKAYHAVINGENFHALQLFTYLYRRSVDCIYIDPPYNTG